MEKVMISTVGAGGGWITVAYTDGPEVVAVSTVSKDRDESRKMVMEDLSARHVQAEEGDDADSISRLAPRILSGDPSVPISQTATTPFRLSVFEYVRRIPKGKVASYSDVARAIGKPRAQRAVGTTMATHCLTYIIPCHRVVKNDLSPGRFGKNPARKVEMLRSEGVEIAAGQVKERYRLAPNR